MSRSCSPSDQSSTEFSNLQSFLHTAMPMVPSKLRPRSCMQDIKNIWLLDSEDSVEYFTLGDLWKSFDEWSAYGVGTPVVLDHGKSVMQYYTPYLSAIQIYTISSSTIFRNESDKLRKSLSNKSSKIWDDSSAESSFDHDISSCSMTNRLGHLYFQYDDVSSPYWRIPLAEKIRNFMPNYPRLGSLTSIDLSPASWISIAWYPIYQIPTKWYVKDLATCFLTYHTLSSSFQDPSWESQCNGTDVGANYSSKAMIESKKSFGGKVALPPFGLATHRMQGDVWINPDKCDPERLLDLHSAADSWLKQLNFHHHDFHFFNMHSKTEMGVAVFCT